MKTLKKRTLSDYYRGLPKQKKEMIINEARRIEKELWAKGFSLGMIGATGQMITKHIRSELKGERFLTV